MAEEIAPEDYYGHEVPVKHRRVKTLTKQQMSEFLVLICEGGGIDRCSREVGTSPWAIYRQCEADEGFAQALEEAKEIRVMLLEDKAFELAYHGETETVTKGSGRGKTENTRTTYPTNALLQFLLRNWKPEVYTDKSELKAGPLDTPPIVIRNEGDRVKLLEVLQKRALPAPARELPEDTETDSFDDLLGDMD